MDIRKVKHVEEDRCVIFGSEYASTDDFDSECASVVEGLKDSNGKVDVFISSFPGTRDLDGCFIKVMSADIDLLIKALQIAKTWIEPVKTEKKPTPRRSASKK